MSGLNDKELAELRKTFDACDLNGDGFINPEEFHAFLIKLDGDVSREECLLDFDVVDTEGDGYIGFKEPPLRESEVGHDLRAALSV